MKEINSRNLLKNHLISLSNPICKNQQGNNHEILTSQSKVIVDP